MNINGTSGSNADYSRITGLATGMDTDGMVKQAIAGEQAKIDQAKQAQQLLEWQQEAYVDIIKDLKEFQNSFLDILGPSETNMMKSTSYVGLTAESSTASKLNATVLSNTIKGNYQVKVEQMAEGAKVISSFDSFASCNLTTKLSDIGITAGSFKISVGGKNFNIEVNDTRKSIGDFVNTLKNAKSDDAIDSNKVYLSSLVDINFSELTKKLSITTKQTGSNASLAISNIGTSTTADNLGISTEVDTPIPAVPAVLKGGDISSILNTDISVGPITLNGQLIDLSGVNSLDGSGTAVTMDALVAAFQSDIDKVYDGTTNGGVKFSVGKTSDGKGITITSSVIGADSTVEFTASDESVLLGFTADTSTSASAVGTDAGTAKTVNPQKGINSKVKIKAPGEDGFITLERENNSISIDNIKFDLLQVTDKGATSDESDDEVISVTVKADATSQVDKFKKFIEKYNSLIEKINGKVTEKKNLNYKPLTDAQKEGMKEDEIKRWEEQAKKGLLARENNLSNLLVQVRQVFYSTVQGVGLNITDIGIGTTSNWRDAGKLEILDEAKLKNALETRGDQVQKLFTQSSDNKDEKGILQRIKDIFNTNIGSEGILIKKAGYENSRYVAENDLSKNIEKKKQAIKDMQSRMYTKQERYYQMFAALERNMNNLNSQSNWLASQLGAV